MPNPTKDQITINALRERVELLEKDNKKHKELLEIQKYYYENESELAIIIRQVERNHFEEKKQLQDDLQICRDAIKNKNEIINKQKDSISDYKSKLMKSNTNLTDTIKRYTKRFNELEERIQELDSESIMLNNDIGIKQRNIEALKLENEELNNSLKIKDKIFYYISIPYLIVSAIYLVITLIK
jgi:chromosome segregation ATPase